MGDFELPSFSLGLDFDLDSQPPPDLEPDPYLNQPELAGPPSSAALNHQTIQEDTDDDFELPPPDPGQDSLILDPPRGLKRLRRGPTSSAQKMDPQVGFPNLDDDIEDFSSQEEDNPRVGDVPAMLCRPFPSRSKLPLHGVGVMTSESKSQCTSGKKKELPNSLGSQNTGSSSKMQLFPEITMSPIRRFQLIDSDSDDFSLDEAATKETNPVISPMNNGQSNLNKDVNLGEKKTQSSANGSQKEDLWKNFCSEKSFHIPTPALDEVCEEYFRSVKGKDQVQNKSRVCSQINSIGNKNVQQCNPVPQPPAYYYFSHDDPRIQRLLRDRLPYFSPLGSTISQQYQQNDASVIDYISQFSHGEGSKQAAKRRKAEVSSAKGRKNAKKNNGKEVSQESENWINPKTSAGIPKDAGQRRVHAVDKSAGHWFTDAHGKRVYVTKNGQELTGQLAYRHYKKESGGGFKKSKKKTSTQRKSNAKKKK